MSSRPDPPRTRSPAPVLLSELAARYDLQLTGPDRAVTGFGTVTASHEHPGSVLTYVASASYGAQFAETDIAACITHNSLGGQMPRSRSALTTAADPVEVFYTVFSDLVNEREWSRFPSYRSASAAVAPTATIHDQVVIGEGCVIMDNVVILPCTYLADRVIVKPGTTIGADGFQLAMIGGHRRHVPHAGGVRIESDVTIGSHTCIDRGLFGDMTMIGAHSHIDSLVYMAHAVRVGADVVIGASAEISGSVTVGDSAWLGPRIAVNPGLQIGAYALVGTGATVVSDIPPHAVAFGVPARVRGWRCSCGERLESSNASTTCARCGSRFEFADGNAVSLGTDAG